MFYGLGFVAIASSLAMIMHQKPINSALYLVITMLAMAGLYALLDAHLIAALQVLVYAGAVMVLFLFVIMLLNLREKERLISSPQIAFQGIVVLLIGAFFVWAIHSADTDSIPVMGEATPDFGSTASVGGLLYTDYILPFEIASVLLLAAIVGAVILAKTKI